MTRAEYLEFVQEHLAFPLTPEGANDKYALIAPETQGLFPCHPDFMLRETPEICRALELAHAKYCAEVEIILFPERKEQVVRELNEHAQLVAVQTMMGNPNAPKNRALEIFQESADFAEKHGFCA